MDPLKTGKLISEARKKLNLTQKNLADKLYVSDKAVSKWERGICFPDISVLIPLTEILNISLYDLLKGEKMNKKDVEETLKDTINYSTNEIERNKKKYTLISIISILAIIIVSVCIIIVNNNSELSGIIDRDEIYDISYYEEYKTDLLNNDGNKIEMILDRLPLSWGERKFKVNDKEIIISYKVSFDKVVDAYNDELYVKRAIINNATVLFTAISDLEKVKVKFNDYIYTTSKKDFLEIYSITNFESISDVENWKNIVSKRLVKDDFIIDTFEKIIKKEKVK